MGKCILLPPSQLHFPIDPFTHFLPPPLAACPAHTTPHMPRAVHRPILAAGAAANRRVRGGGLFPRGAAGFRVSQTRPYLPHFHRLPRREGQRVDRPHRQPQLPPDLDHWRLVASLPVSIPAFLTSWLPYSAPRPGFHPMPGSRSSTRSRSPLWEKGRPVGFRPMRVWASRSR